MRPLRGEVICQVRSPFLEDVGECLNDRGNRARAGDEGEAVEEWLGEPNCR